MVNCWAQTSCIVIQCLLTFSKSRPYRHIIDVLMHDCSYFCKEKLHCFFRLAPAANLCEAGHYSSGYGNNILTHLEDDAMHNIFAVSRLRYINWPQSDGEVYSASQEKSLHMRGQNFILY